MKNVILFLIISLGFNTCGVNQRVFPKFDVNKVETLFICCNIDYEDILIEDDILHSQDVGFKEITSDKEFCKEVQKFLKLEWRKSNEIMYDSSEQEIFEKTGIDINYIDFQGYIKCFGNLEKEVIIFFNFSGNYSINGVKYQKSKLLYKLLRKNFDYFKECEEGIYPTSCKG